MGKILILYDSATGNTAKMAAFVAEGASKVSQTEVRTKTVVEASGEDVEWCDGIAVGSPTNMGILSAKMKNFWDELGSEYWGKIDGRIGCAFSTSGGWGGGAELTCQSLLTVLLNFGFLVFGVPDYVGEQFTLHYGAVMAGEPRNQAEKDACLKLGERLGQWVAAYRDGRKDMLPVGWRNKEKNS